MQPHAIINKKFLRATVVLVFCVFTLLPGCAGYRTGLNKPARTAHLTLQSTGIAVSNSDKRELLFHYIQYSLDGRLIEAHLVKNNYKKTIPISPGQHQLYVERAYRGILSGRALLEENGSCFSFTVKENQNAIFNGYAVSPSEWRASGFDGIRYHQRQCPREKCHPH